MRCALLNMSAPTAFVRLVPLHMQSVRCVDHKRVVTLKNPHASCYLILCVLYVYCPLEVLFHRLIEHG